MTAVFHSSAHDSADQPIGVIWRKAEVVPGKDPDRWRRDFQGWYIYRHHYGLTDSAFGWEIDYIVPLDDGGADELANMRPRWRQTHMAAAMHGAEDAQALTF